MTFFNSSSRPARRSRTLDVRTNAAISPLPMTRAAEVRDVLGWHAEAQRRSRTVDGTEHHLVIVHLVSPDQRTVTLYADVSYIAGKIAAPAAELLGSVAGTIFHRSISPARQSRAREALSRLFEAALIVPVAGRTRTDVLVDLHCAARDLDLAQVRKMRQDLRTAHGTLRLPVDSCATLIEHGFSTFADTIGWIEPIRLSFLDKAAVQQGAAFRKGGWNPEQIAQLDRAVNGKIPLAWAKVPVEQALLAARAGLSAAEARSLLRAGHFSEDTLAMLSALRGNAESLRLQMA